MQRYKSKYTGPQMDVAFERALPGGAIDQSMSSKLDWEGLINPEFTIAQAGIGGNHGSVPYAADCWKLVSGTVSAAPGGGLVLNGVIRQTLETAAGLDVVASINVTSGTATAAYDDATKQFDITSSGGTIKRAHLGPLAVTDWSKIHPTDYGDESAKCQTRYIQNQTYLTGFALVAVSANVLMGTVLFPQKMRVTPALSDIEMRESLTGTVVTGNVNNVISDEFGFSYLGVADISSPFTVGNWYTIRYSASADL